MSTDDRMQWDRRHAAQTADGRPSLFLREIIDGGNWQIPRGMALDIACGQGRNALFLAARGFMVTAVDFSSVALEQARRHAGEEARHVFWRQADLEQIRLPAAAYELAISFNYLQRSLIPQIKQAVKVGGHVVLETYLIDQRTIGRPQNPDYLLRHNELLEHFRGFRILCYREGKFTESAQPAFRAGILAQRTG